MRQLILGIRSAGRVITREPVFACGLVLSAAVGLAANAAAFSIVDGLFLRAAPYPGVERLVHLDLPAETTLRLIARDRKRLAELMPSLYASRSLEVPVFTAPSETNPGSVLSPGLDRDYRVSHASADLLRVFGLPLIAGRDLTADDFRTSPRGAILSETLWRALFGSDETVVGRAVSLHVGEKEVPITVVGIAPSRLNFPEGTGVWIAARLPQDLTTGALVGRLPLTGSLDNVRAVVPEVRVQTLLQRLRPARSVVLAYFVAASLCLFFVAWLQVGSLLTSRFLIRWSDFEVRAALGATAGQLRIFWMGEVTTLLGIATAAACVIAPALTAAVGRELPAEFIRAGVIRFDLSGLAFLLVLSGVGILSVTALPLSFLRKARGQSRAAVTNISTSRWRLAVVVAQVALLTSSFYAGALVIGSYSRVRQADLGFNSQGLWSVSLPTGEPPAGAPRDVVLAAFTVQNARVEQAIARLRTVPGVRGVTAGGWPLKMGYVQPTLVRSVNDAPDAFIPARQARVSPDFFSVLGVSLQSGQEMLPQLGEEARSRFQRPPSHGLVGTEPELPPEKVIVSASYARHLQRHGNPLGQLIELALGGRQQVVGVAPELKLQRPDETEQPTVWKIGPGVLDRSLLVRTSEGTVSVEAPLATITSAIWEGRTTRVSSVTEWHQASTVEYRAMALILAGLLAFSLPAAGLGFLGWASQWYHERRRDCAVRMSLGASTGDVRRLLVRRTAQLAGAGLLLGAVVSVGSGSAMRSSLFGVAPLDPGTFGWVVVLVVAMIGAAVAMPLIKVGRINTSSALREL